MESLICFLLLLLLIAVFIPGTKELNSLWYDKKRTELEYLFRNKSNKK